MAQISRKTAAGSHEAASEEIPFFDEPVFGEPASSLSPTAQRASLAQQALAASTQRLSPAAAAVLSGLNPQQCEAVETVDGPVLVLAGAGTGKTRVLTRRIAYILNTGRAPSYRILAVTFTNKAAHEMKQRVEALIEEQGQTIAPRNDGLPWLGTFHAIGVKILRRHAELVGLKPGFTILDFDDQLRLLKQVIEAAGLDSKRWPARQLAALIDRWKNEGLTPEKIPAGEAYGFAAGKGAELYAAYQNRLKELNAVDFGDLLLECLRLFQENPDVLAEYQRRFQYILVDEYQDTNVVQYLWLRLLGQKTDGTRPNICCVGDDDQSIYGWRGAKVDNILRFEMDFPGAKVIRLEQNYRSTGHILGAASGLIAHNRERLGKTLFTEDEDGEKVVVAGVWDDAEEARLIGEDIEALQRQGHALNDIAILVRASFQMRAFEDRFMTLGLSYRVIGGPRFYERLEIKDAIAYFDVLLNPDNDLRFERIINTPKRGLGETTVKLLHEYARRQNLSLFRAAQELCQTEELRPKTRRALAGLLAQFEHWRGLLEELPHTELAELVLDESGYTAMWQKDKSPTATSRLENLKELVRFMGDFDSLAGFLQHVALVMDAETADHGDSVNLMTLHSAKGLEFQTVFLPGWEEGLFPHQRTLEDNGQAGLEEERRLAYVGLTRARRRAKISFAQNRQVHGRWQASIPSRFIDELPWEHAAPATGESGFQGAGASAATVTWQTRSSNRRQSSKQHKNSPQIIEATAIDITENPGSDYRLGERVFHIKFGYGKIIAIDANKLTIDFEKAGRKRVMASFIERH